MNIKFNEVCNYYGVLEIKEENDKYYWGIENWDDMDWSEIPKYLYEALLKYHNEKDKNVKSN